SFEKPDSDKTSVVSLSFMNRWIHTLSLLQLTDANSLQSKYLFFIAHYSEVIVNTENMNKQSHSYRRCDEGHDAETDRRCEGQLGTVTDAVTGQLQTL
ncbi:hypothetical protein JOB18_009579, partial [Solea senegalensis]